MRQHMFWYWICSCLQSIQVIVQSRLGEKIETQSKANTDGTDWVSYQIKATCNYVTISNVKHDFNMIGKKRWPNLLNILIFSNAL